MQKSLQRLAALIYKETVQILRDRRTLALMFALPIVQLFLFAYAVSLTVDHLPTALVDQSQDLRSREFTHALVNSGYFDVTLSVQSEQEVVRAIDDGLVKAGVVIPPDFSAQVERGNASALILLDGSDSFSVQSGYRAASAIAQNYSIALSAAKLQRSGGLENLPVSTSTRVLYNPDMDGLVFILPGLIAMIIQNIIVANSALAIVRERELGVFEQLLATPARPIEMILAKVVPALGVVFLDMAVVLVLGVFWFGVPFEGSLFTYVLLSVLFIISGVGLGLLVSTFCRTQRQAQQITSLINLLTMLLTGFLYPRATMPLWTQIIGDLIPLTYFLRISRGIITRGVGMQFLWPDALALVVYSAVAILLAAAAFKRRLD